MLRSYLRIIAMAISLLVLATGLAGNAAAQDKFKLGMMVGGNTFYTPYHSYNVLEMSGERGGRGELFTLGALDLTVMAQSAFLTFWLLVYLYCRVRRREA